MCVLQLLRLKNKKEGNFNTDMALASRANNRQSIRPKFEEKDKKEKGKRKDKCAYYSAPGNNIKDYQKKDPSKYIPYYIKHAKPETESTLIV